MNRRGFLGAIGAVALPVPVPAAVPFPGDDLRGTLNPAIAAARTALLDRYLSAEQQAARVEALNALLDEQHRRFMVPSL